VVQTAGSTDTDSSGGNHTQQMAEEQTHMAIQPPIQCEYNIILTLPEEEQRHQQPQEIIFKLIDINANKKMNKRKLR
jgi:hypothetical protein